VLKISRDKVRRYSKYVEGFTLVELIAVLLILGIVASIAIPKYFNLMEDAQQKALDGALAEGKSRVFAHFAKQVVSGERPQDVIYSNITLGTDAGDFSLSYSATDDKVSITVSGLTGNVLGASKSQVIDKPKM
jgi:prepilin-type N-terminal cleavage/methylation domain-containing protein